MINQYKQGRYMVVKGQRYTQDLKIIGGQVAGNWWRRRGHLLEKSDIEDILETKPSVLVVGTGYAGNMRISKNLSDLLFEKDIELVSERTQTAVASFNRMVADGRDVAGAFHLTC